MSVMQQIPNLQNTSAGMAKGIAGAADSIAGAVGSAVSTLEQSRKQEGHIGRIYEGVKETLSNPENLREWGWDQTVAQQEMQKLAPRQNELPDEYESRVAAKMKELEGRGTSFQRLMGDAESGKMDPEQVRQESIRRGMGADPRVQSYLDEGVRANVLSGIEANRVSPVPTATESEAGLGELSELLSKMPNPLESEAVSAEPSAQFQSIGMPKQSPLSSIPMDVQQSADSDLLEQLKLRVISTKEFYKEQAELNKEKRKYEESLSLEERRARNQLALQDDNQEFTASENAMNRASDERRTRMSTEASRAAAVARAKADEKVGEKNLTELLKQRNDVLTNIYWDDPESVAQGKKTLALYDEIIEKQRPIEGVGRTPAEWAVGKAKEMEKRYPKPTGSYSPLLDEARNLRLAREVVASSPESSMVVEQKVADALSAGTPLWKILEKIEMRNRGMIDEKPVMLRGSNSFPKPVMLRGR